MKAPRRLRPWYQSSAFFLLVFAIIGDGLYESHGKESAEARMDVICDGGQIVIQVNGKQVNAGFGADPTAGKLTIQSELAELIVRRWELWPLGKASVYQASADAKKKISEQALLR